MPFLNDFAPHTPEGEPTHLKSQWVELPDAVKNSQEVKNAQGRLEIGKKTNKVATKVDIIISMDDTFWLIDFTEKNSTDLDINKEQASSKNIEATKEDNETLKDTLSTLENLNTKIWPISSNENIAVDDRVKDMLHTLKEETHLWQHFIELEFAQKLHKAYSHTDTQEKENSLGALQEAFMEKHGIDVSDSEQFAVVDTFFDHMSIMSNTPDALEIVKYTHKEFVYEQAKLEMEKIYGGQNLNSKQYEILIHSALELDFVQEAIVNTTNPKIAPLLQEFETTTKGEAVGFLILHELFKDEPHGALTPFVDHAEALQIKTQDYQQEHKARLTDLNYEQDRGSVGLVRNYVDEYLAKSSKTDAVSWSEIEKYATQDQRLSDRMSRSILANLQGIHRATSHTPASYIEGKKEAGQFVQIPTDEIIASQFALEWLNHHTPGINHLKGLDLMSAKYDPDQQKNLEKFCKKSDALLAFSNANLKQVNTAKVIQDLGQDMDAEGRAVFDEFLQDNGYGEALALSYEIESQNQDNEASEHEDILADSDAQESPSLKDQTTFDPLVDDISQYEIGTSLTLPDGADSMVTANPEGVPMLAIDNIPMSLDTVANLEQRNRLLQEGKVSGVNYLTPEQNFEVFGAINEAIRFGGADVPNAEIDLTNGISTVGWERDAYLVVRAFLQSICLLYTSPSPRDA